MESISINKIMARSFINILQYALVVDDLAETALAQKELMRFRLLSDVQLSVLFSLAALVTDRNEVMSEYDRVLMLSKESTPDSIVVVALTEGREALAELLISAKSH